MSSTFNWIFGKKKSSPPPSRADEFKEIEDDYLVVNDGNVLPEYKPNLYPLINPESHDSQVDPGRSQPQLQPQDSGHCDGPYFLSGVPFQIATPNVSENDIAQVQQFLYLTKRTTNLNNYSYDFMLELSVVNQ